MVTNNPYAPPRNDDFSALPVGSGSGVQLVGDTLICEKGASLPPLCLFNGEPGDDRISRTFTWAPQWALVIVAMSPLIGAVVYLIVRKTGKLEYSLGKAARKRMNDARWLLVGGVLGGVILAIVAGVNELPALMLLAIMVAMIVIVVGSVRMRVFTVSRIDKQQIHLKLRNDAARAFERYLAGAR